ncbi:hypothetical protein CRV01_09660 [Arcobacter sp. CECT 8983]|uniref:hypothetical protein n=1 Tax=Arcobacter sp. CECT 8983 TaxID=2044508 RepID=UPI00100AD763|nr:hypothetical protein [Arcobacter sp. CECT 8983]RXJ88877.1 hypothetical protein CRV01_09660 [Arcobacter sp. CECT 8983]
MVLKFKFKYEATNKTYVNILHSFIKNHECEYKILQDLEHVYLLVEAKEEVLEEVSNNLSKYLPMSIYYEGLEVDVVKTMPKLESVKAEEQALNSFCPTCLEEVENEKGVNYYNAFKFCKACKTFENATFLLDEKEEKSSKKLFKKVASLINDNKKIKIKTISGTFVFQKLEFLDKSKTILCTNLKNISSLVVEQKQSIVALASIEKPLITFRINEIYKMKEKVSKEYIDIRVANDLTLYLLSKELEKYKIDFLQIEDENSSYNSFLDVKTEDKVNIDIPKIMYCENRKFILSSNTYSKNLDLVYNRFEEKNKAQFMTILSENMLFDKAILNFYISNKNDDRFTFYSEELNGFVDISTNFSLPKDMNELYKQISESKSGDRLLENYKEKFPLEYENSLSLDLESIKTNSFLSYFKVAKEILGFENDILTNAKNCHLEKGPRVDFKMIENEKLSLREFDYVSMFKSAMSFKLAGVDEVTLSLGFIDSLASFIANEVDTVNDLYRVEGVSLCGDMFTYDIFTKLVLKNITKNYKIYFNREFVIDK